MTGQAPQREETRPVLTAREVVALRGETKRGARLSLDRPQELLLESERLGPDVVPSATAFLTGAECPFRCVYCDLWRHTILRDTPPGAIAAQVAWSMEELRRADDRPRVHTLKLYNASNFFDERAVPSVDDDAILAELDGLERVVVECHPRLLLGRRGRTRAARFADALKSLEVAFGLETTAPGGLERLGKGAKLSEFERAFAEVRRVGGRVRAFVLYGIPGSGPDDLDPEQQGPWTLETVRWARQRGASAVTVIPVRGGNGAMEQLAERGLWRRPTLSGLLDVAEAAMELETGGFDVFVDGWDLESFRRDEDTVAEDRIIARLRALDRGGRLALRDRVGS